MTKKERFIQFYLEVLKNERLYGTQQAAFEKSKAEDPGCPYLNWGSFRCAVCRYLKMGMQFFPARVTIPQRNLDFVAGVFLSAEEAMDTVSESIPNDSAAIIIYQSSDGRLGDHATPVIIHDF